MASAFTFDWFNFPDLVEVLEFWELFSNQFTDMVIQPIYLNEDSDL